MYNYNYLYFSARVHIGYIYVYLFITFHNISDAKQNQGSLFPKYACMHHIIQVNTVLSLRNLAQSLYISEIIENF